jgi:hypothetical protein
VFESDNRARGENRKSKNLNSEKRVTSRFAKNQIAKPEKKVNKKLQSAIQ